MCIRDSVYTMGWGEEGQLGNGEYSQAGREGPVWQSIPEPVRSLTVPLTAAAVNKMWRGEVIHEILERTGGLSFRHGATKEELNRQLLAGQPDNAPAVEVAAGDHHTLVRTADGKVFSFGRGFNGQLGHNDTKQVSIPKRIDAGALRPRASFNGFNDFSRQAPVSIPPWAATRGLVFQ